MASSLGQVQGMNVPNNYRMSGGMVGGMNQMNSMDPFGYNAMAYRMTGLGGGYMNPPIYRGPTINTTGLNIPGAPATQVPNQAPQLPPHLQTYLNRRNQVG